MGLVLPSGCSIKELAKEYNTSDREMEKTVMGINEFCNLHDQLTKEFLCGPPVREILDRYYTTESLDKFSIYSLDRNPGSLELSVVTDGDKRHTRRVLCEMDGIRNRVQFEAQDRYGKLIFIAVLPDDECITHKYLF